MWNTTRFPRKTSTDKVDVPDLCHRLQTFFFSPNWSRHGGRKGMHHSYSLIITGWWFGTVFIFPYSGNNQPNWLIFFRGVEIETTNQINVGIEILNHSPNHHFYGWYKHHQTWVVYDIAIPTLPTFTSHVSSYISIAARICFSVQAPSQSAKALRVTRSPVQR